MEVKFWTFFLVVLLVAIASGENGEKSTHRSGDETFHKSETKDSQPNELKHPPNEAKDYFLPPIFPPHEEEEDDHLDEDDDSIYDYDYDTRDNYKDTATEKSVNDKIPIHTAKDNLPMFLLEPENTYVFKNKPATLKCRAANALQVYFNCNEYKAQTSNFEFVDPQTGVRIIEGEHKVTREEVEEYFGEQKYQCYCVAWTSPGHIKSQTVTIELASNYESTENNHLADIISNNVNIDLKSDLKDARFNNSSVDIKKLFVEAPQSQLVKQNSRVHLHCKPPPAAPFAQQYWLKNGAPVVVDNNVQITKEGDLVIKQVTLLDMANYTCVAENLAGKRISDPALLTVFVNGGWTTWSPWTYCYCSQSRQSTGKKRERTCTAPRPLNGGQPCLGHSVERSEDCEDCDLDLYVDGIDELADDSSDILRANMPRTRWSQWSEWSQCDTDCLQTRRRRCLTNLAADCPGQNHEVAPCLLCVRTSKSHIVHEGTSYWPLLIALSIAFLLFIVVAVLVIKYMKIKMAENSLYVKPPPGSNYFNNVLKRTLTNQPDLTIHEEFHTLDSRRNRHMSTSTHTRQEHLYEVPQLANSYISPIDHEVRPDRSSRLASKDAESDRSDSSCFLSSGSSYNESVEMSPSLKNHTSMESKLNPHLETAISKIVTSDGDWLNLDKCGLNLFVPEGVIDKGEEVFSVEIMDEEWNKPLLLEDETQLSPVVRCCPKNFHFRKGVVLSFPHCASLKNHSWLLFILQKPEDASSREWRKVLTLGQETPGTPIFAQIDPSKVYLMSEFLSDFVLVGKSFSGLDTKLLKLALFVSKTEDSCYNLKINVFNDTSFGFYECSESEKRCGSTLLCDPKTVCFQQNCSDLCFNVRDVGQGWRIKSGAKYQELSYTHLWNMNKYLQCVFVLHQTDSINCLEFNLSIYQKQKQSNSVNFNLKTNDFNSNFKRLSTSSAELGYTVNIFENPFNYSSLSKKAGRYEFVFKNSSFRSNFSVDNNFRINMLTKSDRVILCKLLDSQTTKGNDWRLMAEKLKISSYYYYFSNTCSPTENILNLWMCRNNDVNMLVNLSRIFREMNRIDCAIVVERRCFAN